MTTLLADIAAFVGAWSCSDDWSALSGLDATIRVTPHPVIPNAVVQLWIEVEREATWRERIMWRLRRRGA